MYKTNIKCIVTKYKLCIEVYYLYFAGDINYYRATLEDKFIVDREQLIKYILKWIKENIKKDEDFKYLTLKESYFKKKVNKLLDKLDKNLIEWR